MPHPWGIAVLMVSLFATIAALGPFNIYGCHQGHPPGFSGGASIGAIVETEAVASAVVTKKPPTVTWPSYASYSILQSSKYLFVAK